MKKFEENIRRVTPYVPGEQPSGSDIIKLNTNESPFAPSTVVQMSIASMMPDALRKYPDPDAKDLVREIASYYYVDESKVFVGVGSDDILGMSFLTFFNSDKPGTYLYVLAAYLTRSSGDTFPRMCPSASIA